MEAIKKRKSTIKGQLTKLRKSMEAIISSEKGTVADIEKLSKLEAILIDFRRLRLLHEELVSQLLLSADETKLPEYDALYASSLDELESASDTLFSYEAKVATFHKLIVGMQARESIVPPDLNASFRSSSSSAVAPKLEKIQVPKFNGEILAFQNFKGMFVNLIHNNLELSPVQKLHYLKQALADGNAAGLVRDFPLDDAAYGEAWAFVLSRFDNRRATIRALFRKLYTLQPIQSPSKIRQLLDEVDMVIRGLKAIGETVEDTFSRYVTYVVSTKLDKDSAKDWENSVTSTKSFPTYGELQKFLQGRLFSVEETASEKSQATSKPGASKTVKNSYVITKATTKCSCCDKDGHPLFRCGKFIQKTPKERYLLVKLHNMCNLCLKQGHFNENCSADSSKFKCECGFPHNKLLHFAATFAKSTADDTRSEVKDGSAAPNSEASEDAKKSYNCTIGEVNKNVVLLPSAVVKFRCGNIQGKARVLLDSCSQPTMISDSFVRKFRLPTRPSNSRIRGVSPSTVDTSSCVSLTVTSRKGDSVVTIEADVVPASCLNYAASTSFPERLIQSLRHLELAEPDLLQPGKSIESVDILIGAQYYEDCVRDQSLNVETLKLRWSMFGWLVSGVAPVRANSVEQFSGLTLSQINENLVRFWKIEDVGSNQTSLTDEETQCQKHFEENYSFAEDGKFVVKLPLKVDRSSITSNRRRAEQALFRVENRLSPSLKSAYSDFLTEYLELGHMSTVNGQQRADPTYCIPHREVLRESSSTTPLRVVFNASAKSCGKLSLNEALMVGPNLQRDLFDHLVSFRAHKYICTADIEKMYRMVWVHEEDRPLQHILWRNSPSEPIAEFELRTLTYGTASASFIAQKCLLVIAQACERDSPRAARIIKENFYMDDVTIGAENDEELISASQEVRAVLKTRGFNLRKFASNSSIVLDSLRAVDESCSSATRVNDVAVLGLMWNSVQDTLSIKPIDENCAVIENVTRRRALSVIAKTFDPLGLFAPVLIAGKLLLQELWAEGTSWDDLSSPELSAKFRKFVMDLSSLRKIAIPRRIVGANSKFDSVFAFCDASAKAYCAAVYARQVDSNNAFDCELICAKTRVAPLKELTIPQLELQAALLLATLTKRVCTDLQIRTENVFAFSDSTTVLCWLSKRADNWKVFVKNRVEKIVETLPFERWRYVKTYDNPADKGTRGLSSEDFRRDLDVWLRGPAFTRMSEADTYYPIPDTSTHECLEKRRVEKQSFACSRVSDFTENISRYATLIRVAARVLRFVRATRDKVREENMILSLSECRDARILVIRLSQFQSFAVEIDSLKSNPPANIKTSLATLDPFLDEYDILRVGGRLKNSSLAFQRKHPIILSAKSHFFRMYCRHLHEKYFHAGLQFLVSFLAAEFWLVHGRTNAIKRIIHECTVCRRLKGQAAFQLMGQLPRIRAEVSRPFTYVGVDYAGGFSCKCTAHRSTRYYDIHAAIFVCFVTRAVHIEVVENLTTDSLVTAVLRMMSRRGTPAEIYSDNATNMVGAQRLLVIDEEKIQNFALAESFKWRTIPPRAPNFGGLWEAAVKAAKKHLIAVTRGQTLNLCEYVTVFSRIEAILNSRPLCYRRNAPQGEEVVTPAHFLIGTSLTSLPAVEFDGVVTLSRRLQLLRDQTNSFWNLWSKDYLNQLQERFRWQKRTDNLRVGQVVLVKSESNKPFGWPLGRIEEVFPDPEGLVRVVNVRFRGKAKKRSISALVPLLEND